MKEDDTKSMSLDVRKGGSKRKEEKVNDRSIGNSLREKTKYHFSRIPLAIKPEHE